MWTVLCSSHQCTQAYLMSVVMVVNEKWRERVPAWGTFEALPDKFPSFFQRVLDASLSPLEVSNSDTYTQCVTMYLYCRIPSTP